MKIGFDLDGVLVEQDEVNIVLSKQDDFLYRRYYKNVKPLIYPWMLLSASDVGYIITCRAPSLRGLTQEYCDRIFPGLQLFVVGVEPWTDIKSIPLWMDSLAAEKANVINRLKLDVYFEDNPEVVNKLRLLCKRTKIVQFGGKMP